MARKGKIRRTHGDPGRSALVGLVRTAEGGVLVVPEPIAARSTATAVAYGEDYSLVAFNFEREHYPYLAALLRSAADDLEAQAGESPSV